MYRKKKIEVRYTVFFLLIGIMLVLGGLFYALNEERFLTFIEKGVKDVGLTIQKIIYKPIEFIMGKNNGTEKTEEYKALEAKYNEINKELQEMESLLELNVSLSEGTYVNATAITRNIDYWYQSVSLDKGSKNNVKKGDAVVNSKGLVGYIDSVANYSSTMKLLTAENLNHKISVKIEVGDSYVFGLLTYYDSNKNVFEIEGISENTGIPKEALVTTTGLGNTFPAGLVIGRVDSVELDHFELAKTVYVKPSTDFNDISYVTIIRREGDV